EAELAGDDLHLALELVAVRQVVLVGRAGESIEIFLGSAGRAVMSLVERMPEREHVAKSGQERIENRPFGGELVRLAVVSDARAAADHHLSLVRAELARHEAQQSRFSGAIRRYQPHPVPERHRES